MNDPAVAVTLVIFTCERREHLLIKSYTSFREKCTYVFEKTILTIDGQINAGVISQINPDIVVQHPVRSGYVNSISKVLKLIDTPYFFWLEDDWSFHAPVPLDNLIQQIHNHQDWAEIVLSRFGPLTTDAKVFPLSEKFYQNISGFSANPSLCRTHYLQLAFSLLEKSPKGNKLGEHGFENFLSRTFEHDHVKCVIIDPEDHSPIAHEGYLESTPRNWHMTDSLDKKTEKHLFILPKPSFIRRLYMMIKLFAAFTSLAGRQLLSNKVYEYCFRIIASLPGSKNDDRTA